MSNQTDGERRIGISFNPGGNKNIAEIKGRAAELMDMVSRLQGMNYDLNDLKKTAMTELEGAAMWCVKAASRADDR